MLKFIKLSLIATIIVGLTAFNADARVRIQLTEGNAQPLPIALVPFDGVTTKERELGNKVRDVVLKNLQNSGLFNVIAKDAYLQSAESIRVSGPLFNEWKLINTESVMIGQLKLRGEEGKRKIVLEFRLYDVYGENQLVGKRFTVDERFWRYLGHRISDEIYSAMTGEKGIFNSRIVHIGEEKGKGNQPLKKLCVMDQDGGNYQCLTDGKHLVLTPRFNPMLQKVIYMSYANGKPRLYLLDLPTGRQEIVGDFEGLNSSPRFAPNGKRVAMTLTKGHAGNPEIYTMSLKTKKLKRLTFERGIDTSPSYSPDGKKIVFNSNRGGKPALYIMDVDGKNVKRLTYGKARYYAPVWSPRGDLIAFVKQYKGKFSIGVIDIEGNEERQLTESFMDESPSWSPNGRVIIFARQDKRTNKNRIFTIDLTGYNEREMLTPTDASDPAWSPLLQ